jgi:uncharacterized RDD family membrane protein YckC
MTAKIANEQKGPGLVRRLAVVIYDGLLLAGVVFACWAFLWIALLPLPEIVVNHWAVVLLQRTYLIGITFLFYAWFWVNGGQTLGMRAWRLGLVSDTAGKITWKRALFRYAAAILSWGVVAMGFMWVLVDRRNRTWHGMLSGTRMVVLAKQVPGNRAESSGPDEASPYQ